MRGKEINSHRYENRTRRSLCTQNRKGNAIYLLFLFFTKQIDLKSGIHFDSISNKYEIKLNVKKEC